MGGSGKTTRVFVRVNAKTLRDKIKLKIKIVFVLTRTKTRVVFPKPPTTNFPTRGLRSKRRILLYIVSGILRETIPFAHHITIT